MDNELTATEIEEAIMAARIFSSSYSPEEFEASRELMVRLQDSGELEAVCGLARLEKERGVVCTEAMDTYEQILRDSAELEQKVTDYQATLKKVKGKVTQAQDKLRQIEEATEQAREELQAVQAERQKEERDLATFRRRAEEERRAIQKELERDRREANVTKEEITTAGQLKAEVGKYGFSLDLILRLSQEFKGYEDIVDRVAEGLKSGRTLTEYNNQAEERKQSLETGIKSLERERGQVVSNLSQLRADTAFEEKIRQFYRRYQSAGPLMEWLASWNDIYFGRCGNPTYDATKILNRSIKGAYFWTEKQLGGVCPCCGYPRTLYDEGIYQALNLPIGEPYKLQLGE